jgi:hypothetical protein
MDHSDLPWGYILIGIVAVILILIGIYWIIKSATYGRKIWVESQKQTRLLSEIAKHHGVSEIVVGEINDEIQYKEFEP